MTLQFRHPLNPLRAERSWRNTVPVFDKFSDALNTARYQAVPDGWAVGVSDIVNSTGSIEQGRYKDINFVGAAAIAAVSNAIGGDLPFYVFGGDGSRFVVPPEHKERAREALSRVARWARQNLDLQLRVGMMDVADIRDAGRDVRVAFFKATETFRQPVFAGGGLELAEKLLKSGSIGIAPGLSTGDPDLSGLSCQWGPIQPVNGRIVSLIVKPAADVTDRQFTGISHELIGEIHRTEAANPVPPEGPSVQWPGKSLGLQAQVPGSSTSRFVRKARTTLTAMFTWLVFRTGIRIGGFEPSRYRREIATNTDFRKFDDGLYFTLDCSDEAVNRLRAFLDEAAGRKLIRYGMHLQDQALLTCVATEITTSNHMHFIDGSGGGYVAAARQLREAASG